MAKKNKKYEDSHFEEYLDTQTIVNVDIEKRIEYFSSLGMSDEEVKIITLQQPNVLVYSLNRMNKIQKQYMEDGMDIEQYKEMLLNKAGALKDSRKSVIGIINNIRVMLKALFVYKGSLYLQLGHSF